MSHLINIEQIRAKNALGTAAKNVRKKSNEGDNLAGYPSLIINNGLIATIAFSIDKGNQHQRIADALAFHLNERKILSAKDAMGLRDALCNGNASTLQHATQEALQFLSYLKRFQHG